MLGHLRHDNDGIKVCTRGWHMSFPPRSAAILFISSRLRTHTESVQQDTITAVANLKSRSEAFLEYRRHNGFNWK